MRKTPKTVDENQSDHWSSGAEVVESIEGRFGRLTVLYI